MFDCYHSITSKCRVLCLTVLLFPLNVFANECLYVVNAECPLKDQGHLVTEFTYLFSSTYKQIGETKVCSDKVLVNKAVTQYLRDKKTISDFCKDDDDYHFANFINVKSTYIFSSLNEYSNTKLAIKSANKKGRFLIDNCLALKSSTKCRSNFIDSKFVIANLDNYL